jgi:hypothetical protein
MFASRLCTINVPAELTKAGAVPAGNLEKNGRFDMKNVSKSWPESGCTFLGSSNNNNNNNNNSSSSSDFLAQCTRKRIVLSVLADLIQA